jgi:rhodanese-related sulfurtransferase
MGVTSPRPIDTASLHALIVAGGELALLDVREDSAYGQGHLLFAVSLPLSILEMRIDDLVPRRSVPVVLCAGPDDDALIHAAAGRLAGFGYTDLSYLEGGTAAWEAAGYVVFSGINVPSKAFGEFIEATYGTPHVKPAQLKEMMDAGIDLVVVDSRPMSEFRVMNIPGGIDVPGAELAYRIHDIAPDPETLVVVNCAGRTRSIIGAQSLINAGIPNRVVALENGTMGWHLAGLELEHGKNHSFPPVSAEGLRRAKACAARTADRFAVPTADHETLEAWRPDGERTLFLLDVRDPAEYAAGHLVGARSAPGGQLIQATDRHIGIRGARVVLADDHGVRATMTASWLIQMGWNDVYVFDDAKTAGPLVAGAHRPHVRGLDAVTCDAVTADDLVQLLASGDAVVADLADSLTYRGGHVPGAWFAKRLNLPANLAALPQAPTLVLTSPDGVLARLAAAEAVPSGRAVRVLEGGTAAWVATGRPLQEGPSHLADAEDDVWYRPYDREHDVEAAMKEYLTWEVGLVEQIERDGTARYRTFS